VACRRLLHPAAAPEAQPRRAYDFVSETTHDGRRFRILTVIDEYTRECLALRVARRFTAHDVLYTLSELFLENGVPEHIRSDNGP